MCRSQGFLKGPSASRSSEEEAPPLLVCPFFCWGIFCAGVGRSPRPLARRDLEHDSVWCVFREIQL